MATLDVKSIYKGLVALRERLSNGDSKEAKSYTIEDAEYINQVIEYIERNEPKQSLT